MSAAPRRRPASRRSSRAGFTLIEMMVALAAGLIVISSVYFMVSSSSRHFHEQQRVAQSQMSLRMATEQVRRDFGRAGFMGSPSSSREASCPTVPAPGVPVQAIQVQDGAGTGALPNAATNRVQADRVLLSGNYVTADSYLVGTSDGTGRTLFLQQSWQGYRRSTSGDLLGTFSIDAFNDVFRVGRSLHVQNRQGKHFFVRITGTDPARASITITPGISPGGNCTVGLLDGATVSPITRVEYLVQNVGATASLTRLRSAGSPLAGVNGPALIRREVAFDAAATPIAGSERVVLEHVANFDVDVVVDDAVAAGLPADLQLYDDANATTITAPGGRPFAVRSAIVQLSARSAAEDPRFEYVARLVGQPLTRYELDTVARGAARVRSNRTEVLLPNLVSRGLR